MCRAVRARAGRRDGTTVRAGDVARVFIPPHTRLSHLRHPSKSIRVYISDPTATPATRAERSFFRPGRPRASPRALFFPRRARDRAMMGDERARVRDRPRSRARAMGKNLRATSSNRRRGVVARRRGVVVGVPSRAIACTVRARSRRDRVVNRASIPRSRVARRRRRDREPDAARWDYSPGNRARDRVRTGIGDA